MDELKSPVQNYPVLRKEDFSSANLRDFSGFARSFNWQQRLQSYLEERNGKVNIAHEILDRHLGTEIENQAAFKFIGKNWQPEIPGVAGQQENIKIFTYRDFVGVTNQVARAFARLGLKAQERVFVFSPRIPELYFAILGGLKGGQVISPLFSAFGPEPIAARLSKGGGKAIFTLTSYYKKKIAPIRQQLPSLEHILLVDDDGSLSELLKTVPGACDFVAMIAAESAAPVEIKTQAEDMALLHFTSGTTGKPKGAIHVHQAVLYHWLSGQWALDLKPRDQFWCTADPGWVTGMSYGIISPLANGACLVIDEADFQAERWYQILAYLQVDVWYTAPTALRMLMKSGAEIAKPYDLSGLRFVASVGEPLNPEVIMWAKDKLGLFIHDNWWQTETGGIMISNFAALAIKPGSMGRTLPGVEVALVASQEKGKLHFVSEALKQGELALRIGWPAMFRGYLGDDERYKKCFIDDWYLTGDLAYRDVEDYFWFVGRTDDVIKSSGHLIGPFEVESVLLEHQAVAEAAVIGIPDPVAGEVVKAFVALKFAVIASEDLKLEILGYARKRLGPAVAPRELVIMSSLPKTRSGKILRRLLKARELGLPEGDISTLETNL